MSTSVPVYVVSPSDGWGGAVRDLLDDVAGVFGSPDELLASGLGADGGVVLLAPDVPDPGAARLTEALGRGGGPWSVFRGSELRGDGGVDVSPVPLPGRCAITLADLVGRLRRSEEPLPSLELCEVLSFVARARHDINNPLTSALAETQLLLLDVEDPEIRRGLETVEAQLRRIRDLVAGLQALPRPRSRDGASG